MKKWIFAIPLLIAMVIIFFISGPSFTAISAAKSHSFLPKDAELVEQFDTGTSILFLFKSDGEKNYHTVLAERSGVFYRSSSSTYFPYSTDKIQTVGGMSFTSENDEASLLSVISYDEEIAFIEAGAEDNIERKEINKGERVTFLFPYSEQLDFLYPRALNKEGEILYYYGYPKDTNVTYSGDLRWYKVDGQS